MYYIPTNRSLTVVSKAFLFSLVGLWILETNLITMHTISSFLFVLHALGTDWYCRLPGCTKNRCRLHDCIYGFCERQHYVDFGESKLTLYIQLSLLSTACLSLLLANSYCLYDDCYQPKGDDGKSDFCGPEHLEMAVNNGWSFLKLDPNSRIQIIARFAFQVS